MQPGIGSVRGRIRLGGVGIAAESAAAQRRRRSVGACILGLSARFVDGRSDDSQGVGFFLHHQRSYQIVSTNKSTLIANMMARLWAALFWVMFALAMVINGLVNAGIVGQLTVAQISATHPVYLTPASYAFFVWILSARADRAPSCRPLATKPTQLIALFPPPPAQSTSGSASGASCRPCPTASPTRPLRRSARSRRSP